MREQLKYITDYKEQLMQIKLKLYEVIQETEKNTNFPMIPTLVGTLLALFGGHISGFGLNLTGESVKHYNNQQFKVKDIRQHCISLNKEVEFLIRRCECLKKIAQKSFINPILMKNLKKKQDYKNFVEVGGNLVFTIILFVSILLSICSLVLLFRLDFGGAIVAFLLSSVVFLIAGAVATHVLDTNDKWQKLLEKLADNDSNI